MTPTARRGLRVAVLAVALVLPAVAMAPPGDASPGTGRPGVTVPGADRVDPWTYRPPVDAPVVDPFRPPPRPWAPGNRGLEYGSVPGTPVGAIGPGVVTFAGPVAGTLHVTVLHPDGLRSSYSFVAAVRVAVDQRVAAGEVVAVAGEGLHLGVRRGDTYLDPASLWGRRVGPGRVVLVPDGRSAGSDDRRGGGGGGRRGEVPSPPPRASDRPGAALLGRALDRAGGALVAAGTPW